jgi:hypothetical protein
MLAIVGDVVLAVASLILVAEGFAMWRSWTSDARRRRQAGIR